MESVMENVKARFHEHPERHDNVPWERVVTMFYECRNIMSSVMKMEEAGHEPDVIRHPCCAALQFVTCSLKAPGKFTYGDALHEARSYGANVISKHDYRVLQQFGEFDRRVKSWILDPVDPIGRTRVHTPSHSSWVGMRDRNGDLQMQTRDGCEKHGVRITIPFLLHDLELERIRVELSEIDTLIVQLRRMVPFPNGLC